MPNSTPPLAHCFSRNKPLQKWSIKVVFAILGMLLLSACQTSPTIEPSQDSTDPAVAATESEASECECPSISASLVCETGPAVEAVVAPEPSCPPPPAPVGKIITQRTLGELLVIGRVENVYLPDKLKFKARIDTGESLSALHTSELVEFERDGKPWVRFAIQAAEDKPLVYYELPVKRFITTKQSQGTEERRPTVAMGLTMGPLDEKVEMTLTDRSGSIYDVLIGRNFLRDRAIVDVSKKFTATLPKK